jgi:hypothetical protein
VADRADVIVAAAEVIGWKRSGRKCFSNHEETRMAELGGRGNGIQLYGVILRDRIKSADVGTLTAYRTVAHDLLHGASGPDADDLRAALRDLEGAIKAKGG